MTSLSESDVRGIPRIKYYANPNPDPVTIRENMVMWGHHLTGYNDGRSSEKPIHIWTCQDRYRTQRTLYLTGKVKYPYSECGDLPAALLWLVGFRDNDFVNRNVPEHRLSWDVGANIVKLMSVSEVVDAGTELEAGDILILGDARMTAYSVHACVFESFDQDGNIVTFDAAQYSNDRERWPDPNTRSMMVSRTHTKTTKKQSAGDRIIQRVVKVEKLLGKGKMGVLRTLLSYTHLTEVDPDGGVDPPMVE